jgi:hypothetical protein
MGLDIYTKWLACRLPPRANTVRVIPCNANTTSFELDNDLFQFAAAGSAVGTPGSYGVALCMVQNDGANNLYVQFGPTNAVRANSLANNSSNVSDRCIVIPPNSEKPFYLIPGVDKFLAAQCISGSANTTTCRLQIITETLSWPPGGG